jgi:hypothetical protein
LDTTKKNALIIRTDDDAAAAPTLDITTRPFDPTDMDLHVCSLRSVPSVNHLVNTLKEASMSFENRGTPTWSKLGETLYWNIWFGDNRGVQFIEADINLAPSHSAPTVKRA